MGGLSECPTPAVFEAAFVFDEAVEVLDLQASAVPFFPGGSSVVCPLSASAQETRRG